MRGRRSVGLRRAGVADWPTSWRAAASARRRRGAASATGWRRRRPAGARTAPARRSTPTTPAAWWPPRSARSWCGVVAAGELLQPAAARRHRPAGARRYSPSLRTHTHTHTRLMTLCPRPPRWAAGTRKVNPIWISLKQETVSGSGISWAVCKSAPRSRQITTPATHHSVFLQAGCPSCRPTNSVKALKAESTCLPSELWHSEGARARLQGSTHHDAIS